MAKSKAINNNLQGAIFNSTKDSSTTLKPSNITPAGSYQQVEVLETANESLLNDVPRLRQFFKQAVEKIIKQEEIDYKTTPKDPDKIYPKVDVFGWALILDSLKYVLRENYFLFADGFKPNGEYIYNYNKIMALWDIYIYLCLQYGFIPNIDGFFSMTGLTMENLLRWGSTKGVDLVKIMRKAEKVTFISTFRDSKVPIERIYAANNLYSLDKGMTQEETAPELDTLPDLLALPDREQHEIDTEKDTILTLTESPENTETP